MNFNGATKRNPGEAGLGGVERLITEILKGNVSGLLSNTIVAEQIIDRS